MTLRFELMGDQAHERKRIIAKYRYVVGGEDQKAIIDREIYAEGLKAMSGKLTNMERKVSNG